MGGFGAASAAQVAGPALSAAAGGDGTAATAETVGKDCEEAVSTRHAAAGFTDNLKCLKKSTPIMGNFTFTKRKIHEKPFSPTANMLAAGPCEMRTGGRV